MTREAQQRDRGGVCCTDGTSDPDTDLKTPVKPDIDPKQTTISWESLALANLVLHF